MYRQSSLSEAQDQRFLVWCEGRQDRISVVKALRQLDKVIKDKGKGAYLTEDSYGNPFGEEAFLGEFPEDADEDDENYIYLLEGDLNEVMEEKDVIAALASYVHALKLLKIFNGNSGTSPSTTVASSNPRTPIPRGIKTTPQTLA